MDGIDFSESKSMGSGDQLGELTGATFSNPLMFISSKTVKFRYRETLRIQMDIISAFSQIEKKYEAICEVKGHSILLSCDNQTQDLLNQAENSGSLRMTGIDMSKSSNRVISRITDAIA